MSATLDQVIDTVPLTTIMRELGFTVPRRGNRTTCILHGGKNPTFSFHESRGVWNCFACNENGGKIALVARALGYTHKAALEWIADIGGFQLSDTPARRIDSEARSEAEQLLDWRDSVILHLRLKREITQIVYWMAVRLCRPEESELWLLVQDLDEKILWHEEAPMDILVSIFRDRFQFRQN